MRFMSCSEQCEQHIGIVENVKARSYLLKLLFNYLTLQQ